MAFARWLAIEEALNADVFVEVRPVEAMSLADKPPSAPLVGRAVKQPGEPGQRYGNRPSVGQLDRKRFVGYRNGRRGG